MVRDEYPNSFRVIAKFERLNIRSRYPIHAIKRSKVAHECCMPARKVSHAVEDERTQQGGADSARVAELLHKLGKACQEHEDYAEARAQLEAALAIHRELALLEGIEYQNGKLKHIFARYFYQVGVRTA